MASLRTEVKIEEKRKALEVETDKAGEVDRTSPMGALEARSAERRIERQHGELTSMRLRVAGYVVACAMVGEWLHGFGDLLMCSILVVCANQ
jgi:hypothetical protein